MSFKIILFGRLADIAGDSVTVDDVSDTDGLVKTLHESYPGLAEVKYVIAVNKQVINANTILNNNSMVVLLPPFSGG